ncbi:MAG: hypothetical protein ACPGXI_00820 [Mycobacterium sp.]
MSVRGTLVLVLLRVVSASELSSSRVLGGRELGFRLETSAEPVLVGVGSGLMSLVMGGLVLVIVLGVVGFDEVPVADDGPT